MTDELRWMKTHCARMDHGDAPCWSVSKITGLKPSKGPEGFLNKGYICVKGIASPDRLTHPDRLKHPLKRVGKKGEGKWERISWPEALHTIAENLLKIKEQYGARGVAFGVGMPKGWIILS